MDDESWDKEAPELALNFEGVAHLTFFEGGARAAGHFVDLTTRKSLGVACTEITASKEPSCCWPDARWYSVAVADYSNGKQIEFEVLAPARDNVSFTAPWCDFKTQSIKTDSNALAHVKKFLPSFINEVGADPAGVIVCVGPMQLRGIDFEDCEEGQTVRFPPHGKITKMIQNFISDGHAEPDHAHHTHNHHRNLKHK